MMQLTNRLNLPSTIVNAIQHDDYSSDGDISATGLIIPPRIRQLTIRHGDSFTMDVSDGLWMLFGKMFHYVLEKYKTDSAIVEKRLATIINGWKVTGQADLYENETLYDYKFTTIWSYIYGLKSEWEAQVNIYAFLFQELHPVKELNIIMGLRDWQKQKRGRSDYPDSPLAIVNVPLWPLEKAREYIQERVHLHQVCETLEDKNLPLCTSEERWERPTTYAVKVKGQKKARRVLGTMEEAKTWMENHEKTKPMEIETRVGESVRCTAYCDCAPKCDFYQKKIFNKFFKEG